MRKEINNSYTEFTEQQMSREITPQTPGFGKHVRMGVTIMNLTGNPITVVDRKGLKYTLPDQRRDEIMWKDSPCKTVTNVYDPRYTQVKEANFNKESGIYVYISYVLSAVVNDSFQRHWNSVPDKELKPYYRHWSTDFENNKIVNFDKDSKSKGKTIWQPLDPNTQEAYFSEEVFIPASSFAISNNVYSVRTDFLFSTLDIYAAPDHPYSQEGLELRRIEEAKTHLKENPNLETRIRFVDNARNVPRYLYLKTIRGCRLIYPELPSEQFPDPGIYIDDVYYDDNDVGDNQIRHIKIDYADDEELKKNGIYKTYQEATMTPKVEVELQNLKYKKEEAKKKDLSNILNHSSAIIIAVSTLLTKLVVYLTMNAAKNAAKT